MGLSSISIQACTIIALTFLTFTPIEGGKHQRIVGGSDAVEGEFPYQVSIRRNDSHICGGVIISNMNILTAARCVVKNFANDGIEIYSPKNFNIRIGSLSLYESGLLVRVSGITVHQNYTNLLNDVALLKLSEPLIYSDYIQPITLPYDTPMVTSSVTVIGWGFHKTSGDLSRQLQQLQMDVVATSECFSHILGDQADLQLLCLQSSSESGICTGDIGGVAVHNNALVGVASFTLESCGSQHPDGFTNVVYYRQWIKDNSNIV